MRDESNPIHPSSFILHPYSASFILHPSEALDLLTSLVDKSLVAYEEREGKGRYRLLETVCQYSRERLEERGEAEECGSGIGTASWLFRRRQRQNSMVRNTGFTIDVHFKWCR